MSPKETKPPAIRDRSTPVREIPQHAGSKPAAAAKASGAPGQPIQVPGRWLLSAVAGTLLAAALCAWGALCLLFWQGGWQLLYHPTSLVARTPAAAGLPFDPIGFATTGTGLPRLIGWWIPAAAHAPFSRYTVLYLHGQNGNLGGTVDHLAQLHSAGVNLFAFDYRGYGQSQFTHPSERHWLEDAGWALQYLTATRHIAPGSIVLDGSDLGANLALECAAAHPQVAGAQLAGVVLESPLPDATRAIFMDERSRLVPARLLVHDRYDLRSAAAALRTPSLWFLPASQAAAGNHPPDNPEFLQSVSAPKMVVWLPAGGDDDAFADEFSRWLGELRAP
ncbi:MAG TPA: alpha/beta fold hydrolase [Terracidiphilus sp.]|jgi:hypothetical protein